MKRKKIFFFDFRQPTLRICPKKNTPGSPAAFLFYFIRSIFLPCPFLFALSFRKKQIRKRKNIFDMGEKSSFFPPPPFRVDFIFLTFFFLPCSGFFLLFVSISSKNAHPFSFRKSLSNSLVFFSSLHDRVSLARRKKNASGFFF